MRVGILQCGHVPDGVARDHGDFPAMFEALLAGRGFAFRTWDVENMDFPAGPEAADGWLITGSRHGAYEDHPFIAPLEALIREIVAAGRPLVGVCFGHQIVATALGGRVEKHAGGWAIGRTAYEIEGLGAVHLNAWHQDQVTELPPGARVAGTGPGCRVAALEYGPGVWTIQPHPEFASELVAAYVAARRGTGSYPDELMERAEAALPLPLDRGAVAERMARVLGGGRAHA